MVYVCRNLFNQLSQRFWVVSLPVGIPVNALHYRCKEVVTIFHGFTDVSSHLQLRLLAT
jgi:hypothetical protein